MPVRLHVALSHQRPMYNILVSTLLRREARQAKATLKVRTGSVADHVNNWGAVRDTLRGTRYEKYLPQPIDPIIDPSNPRLPL